MLSALRMLVLGCLTLMPSIHAGAQVHRARPATTAAAARNELAGDLAHLDAYRAVNQ